MFLLVFSLHATTEQQTCNKISLKTFITTSTGKLVLKSLAGCIQVLFKYYVSKFLIICVPLRRHLPAQANFPSSPILLTYYLNKRNIVNATFKFIFSSTEVQIVLAPRHKAPSTLWDQQQDFEGKSCTFCHEQDFCSNLRTFLDIFQSICLISNICGSFLE